MLTRDEVLLGHRFDDAIAQGTWPVDLHNPHGAGTSLYYLDGTTRHRGEDNIKRTGRWDGQPEDAPKRDTLCWQVPFRSLVPAELDNVLVAGRCIGAHHDAAGAIRVMVNCMQFGEAAGSAAALAHPHGRPRDVDPATLRDHLVRHGMPLQRPTPTDPRNPTPGQAED